MPFQTALGSCRHSTWQPNVDSATKQIIEFINLIIKVEKRKKQSWIQNPLQNYKQNKPWIDNLLKIVYSKWKSKTITIIIILKKRRVSFEHRPMKNSMWTHEWILLLFIHILHMLAENKLLIILFYTSTLFYFYLHYL